MRTAAIALHARMVVPLRGLCGRDRYHLRHCHVRWQLDDDSLRRTDIMLVGPVQTLGTVARPEQLVAHYRQRNRLAEILPEEVARVALVAGNLDPVRAHIRPEDGAQIVIDRKADRTIAAELFLDHVRVRSAAGHVLPVDVRVAGGGTQRNKHLANLRYEGECHRCIVT